MSSRPSQSPVAGEAHAVAVPDDCCILGQILIDIGAAHLLQTFLEDGDNDSTLQTLSEMGPKKLSRLYGMTQELAEYFISRYRDISEQRIDAAERARDAAEAQAAAAARAAAAAAAEADGEDDGFGDFDSAPPATASGEEAGVGALPGDAEPSVDCGGGVVEAGTGEDAKAAERARDAAEAQAAAAARAAAAAAAEADGEDDGFGDFDSAPLDFTEVRDTATCLSLSGDPILSDSLADAFSVVSSSIAWDDQATQFATVRQQDQVYTVVSEEIEFDLDSGFGDFSSSLDMEQQYASADVIVVDGGGFLQSGDDSDNSDEFGEFINHEEAQRMLLCPTSLQTAEFGSSAEKVGVLS